MMTSHLKYPVMRTGIGYDIHRFAVDRRLVLGGVTIPFDKGLLGHSDADVLLHAICDALLGAAGLGDIGIHFPDTDMRYKDISSILLLKQTHDLLRQKGYAIQNIDATIFAQMPKIAPYRASMIETISLALQITSDQVNIKATTTEGLGLIGAGEGIAAMSIALIYK